MRAFALLALGLTLAATSASSAATPVQSTTPCVTVDTTPQHVKRALPTGKAAQKDYYFREAHDYRQSAKEARARAKRLHQQAEQMDKRAGMDDGLAGQAEQMARGL